jgi:hypothetical protein
MMQLTPKKRTQQRNFKNLKLKTKIFPVCLPKTSAWNDARLRESSKKRSASADVKKM